MTGESCLYAHGVGVELGGRPVLEEIDLSIRGGVPVALTGRSGAGKTVLCLVLAGALGTTRGTVELDPGPGTRVAISATSGRDGTTAIILQSHGLVPGLRAEENVALPLQARGLPRTEVAKRVRSTLDLVGLVSHARRSVDELSGGERQRVGIARALALTPLLLVADEPTAELDPDNRTRVIQLLVRAAERGASVLVTSDDPDVLASCDATFLLDAGCVVRAPDPA